jgi:hypothetical protein
MTRTLDMRNPAKAEPRAITLDAGAESANQALPTKRCQSTKRGVKRGCAEASSSFIASSWYQQLS